MLVVACILSSALGAWAQPVVISGQLQLDPASSELENRDVIVAPGATLTLGGLHRFASLRVAGMVTHRPEDPLGVNLVVDGLMWIESGGRIDVTGAGYLGGLQPGNQFGHQGQTVGANGQTIAGSTGSAGGSHATPGEPSFQGLPSRTYGSEIAPVNLGSGGSVRTGGSPGPVGGNGGGRIQIRARDFVIDGALRANGTPAFYVNLGTYGQDGGGSGGSIYLISDSGLFAGSGSIEALGGRYSTAPAGGLGRIAVVGYATNAFSGRIDNAGTVFTQQAGTGGVLGFMGASLVINSNTTQRLAGLRSISNATATVFNRGILEVDGDHLVVGPGVTLVQDGEVRGYGRTSNWIGAVTVTTNGLMTHSQGFTNGLQLRVGGTVRVEGGGRIDVTGAGYLGGLQPGNQFGSQGQTVDTNGQTIAGSTGSAGGSHATPGEPSFQGLPSPTYGSEIAPVNLGSGGSVRLGGSPGPVGGNGGGRIQIRARDFVIDGALRANGIPAFYVNLGTYGQDGGGSGGSIYLISDSGLFAGSGSIEALGGRYSTAPAGGLGRIAVVGLCQNDFVGSIQGSTPSANAPPVISFIPNQVMPEDSVLRVDLTVSDLLTGAACLAVEVESDNPVLLPASSLSLEPAGGVRKLTLMPSLNQFGTAVLRARVSDGQKTATNSFSVTVTPVNDPPLLASLPDAIVVVGEELVFNLSATDVDDAALTFTGTNLPAGATLNPQTGLFRWTPATHQAIQHVLRFSAMDAGGLSSTQTKNVLIVDLRWPWFTEIPSGQIAPAGAIVELFGAARNPDSFQWFYNDLAIPGATNASLTVSNLSVSQAGRYRLRAINQFGFRDSPDAIVGLRAPRAVEEGPRLQALTAGFRPSGALSLRLESVPGKKYYVQRLRDLVNRDGTNNWETVSVFTSTSEEVDVEDPDAANHPSGFYRLVEETLQAPADFSLEDTTRFVSIGADGGSRPGTGPDYDPATGRLGALEIRPDGSAFSSDRSPTIRLPDGGRVVEQGGDRCLEATNYVVEFPPGSPLQFSRPIRGTNATSVCVPLGPLEVSTLEALAGEAPGSGVSLRLFGRFDLRLVKGQFVGGEIRQAQFATVAVGGVRLPLPGRSAAYLDFHVGVELRDNVLRLPFHGEFPLDDGSNSPLRLRVPEAQPVMLSLFPDGHFTLTGRAEAEFSGGARFTVDVQLEDPLYRLAITAKNLRVPPLMNVPGLLPVPTVAEGLGTAALNALQFRLENALDAHVAFNGLVQTDREISAPTAASAFMPASEPVKGVDGALRLWRALLKEGIVGGVPPQAIQAARDAGRAASSTGNATESVRIVAELKELNQAVATAEADFEGAFREAVAAAQRLVKDAPDSTPLVDVQRIAGEVLRLEAVGQTNRTALETGLRPSAISLVERAALYTISTQLGLRTDGTFSTNTLLVTMPRWEAQHHFRNLAFLTCIVRGLGSTNSVFERQLLTAMIELRDLIFQDLESAIEEARLKRETRLGLLLLDELAHLASHCRLVEMGTLPMNAALDQALSYLESAGINIYDYRSKLRAFTTAQLRDEAELISGLIRQIPPGMTRPISPVRALHLELGEVLAAMTARLAAAVVHPPQELTAHVAALLAHEEIRLRYALTPDTESLLPSLASTVGLLRQEAIRHGRWGELAGATKLLLDRSRRFAGLQPIDEIACKTVEPIGAPESSVRASRNQVQALASALLAASRQIADGLWQQESVRRAADPALIAADMILPGGFTVEEASGELSYDRNLRQVRGTVTGRMRVPQFNGQLEIINATIESGGAGSFSLAGTASFPRDNPVGRVEIPRRRPLTFTLDSNRKASLSGSANVRLRNGAAFEGWINFSDPLYQIGAKATGLRFQMATNFVARVQVPDLDQIARIPDDLQPVLTEYFTALGRTLDPLTDLADAPQLASLGEPPEFAESVVTIDTAPVTLASTFLPILVKAPPAFGFQTLAQAQDTVTQVWDRALAQLDREIEVLLRESREFEDEDFEIKKANSINGIDKVLKHLATAKELGTVPSTWQSWAGDTWVTNVGKRTIGVEEYIISTMQPLLGQLVGFGRNPNCRQPQPAPDPVPDPRGFAPPPPPNCAQELVDPRLMRDPQVQRKAREALRALLEIELQRQTLGADVSTIAEIASNEYNKYVETLHVAGLWRYQELENRIRAGEEPIEEMLAASKDLLTQALELESDRQNITGTIGDWEARMQIQIRNGNSLRYRAFQILQRRLAAKHPHNGLIRAQLKFMERLEQVAMDATTRSLGQTSGATVDDFDRPLPGPQPPCVREFPDPPCPTQASPEISWNSLEWLARTESGIGNDEELAPLAAYRARKENGTLSAEDRRLGDELERFMQTDYHAFKQTLESHHPGSAASSGFVWDFLKRLSPTQARGLAALYTPAAELEFARLRAVVLSPQGFRLGSGKALEFLRQAIQTTKELELAGYQGLENANARIQELDVFRDTLLPRITAEIDVMARAKQAWWLATEAARILQEGVASKASTNWTLVDIAARDAAKVTLGTAAELLGALRNRVRSQQLDLDLRLPGDLVIRDAWGQLTFNTRTRFAEGCFGGELQFPEFNDFRVRVPEVCFATDGSFRLSGSLTNLPAGELVGQPVSFAGGFSVEGRSDPLATPSSEGLELNEDWKGWLALTGSGTLRRGTGPGSSTATAGLTYSLVQEGPVDRWRLGFDLAFEGVQRFGPDAVLFKASGALGVGESGGTQNGSLRLGGKLGLWRKNRGADLPTDDALIQPELFQLVVDEVQMEIAQSLTIANGATNGFIQLTITNGALRLPDLFQTADLPPELACSPTNTGARGPVIQIAPGKPLTLRLDYANNQPGWPKLQGGLRFSQIGFAFPRFPTFGAVICQADLLFESNGPVLAIADGRMHLPLPGQNLALSLRDARFGLDALPIGTVALAEAFTLFDLGGVKAEFLPATRPFRFQAAGGPDPSPGTQWSVINPDAPADSGRRNFRFDGAIELSVPMELVSAEASGTGGVRPGVVTPGPTVGALVAGWIELQSNGPNVPKLVVALSDFGISGSAGATWRLGNSGIQLVEPGARFTGLTNLLDLSPERPLSISLSGGLQLGAEFRVDVRNARFIFEHPGQPPRFQVDAFEYQEGTNAVIANLPVRLTRAGIAFRDSSLSLPGLLAPGNLTAKFSARVEVPPGTNALLVGEVSDVEVSFNADGSPAIPSLDGLELGLVSEKLRIPPFESISGRVRLGGLQGASLDDVYFVGDLQGKMQTAQVRVFGAFKWNGPLGLCLDLSLGAAGVPIPPTGFVIMGGQGGISFVEGNGDPCAFSTYFDRDATGRWVARNNSLPQVAVSWDTFRSIANRMTQLADQLPKPEWPLPGGGGAPTADSPSSSGSPAVVAGFPPGSNSSPDDCPGDCPPRTVSILCQPHPDGALFPNRVILKFSSIPRSVLDRPEIRDTIAHHPEASALAGAMAQFCIAELRRLTPMPDLPAFAALAEYLTGAILAAEGVVSNKVFAGLNSLQGDAGARFDRIVEVLYAGVPCQDMTLALAGRVSYTGLSGFAYVEGRMVRSTAGSDGVIGTVNLLGMPVGQGRVFVSATDNQGHFNPSLCGSVAVTLGPLDVGHLKAEMRCDGCIDTLAGVVIQLARLMGETLTRTLLTRASPDLDWGSMSQEQMLARLAGLTPQRQTEIKMRTLGEIGNLARADLPRGLGAELVRLLGAKWDDIQPQMTLCGEVQPRLFGLPLTLGGRFVSASMHMNKEGYAGSFSFSPSALTGLFPPGDEAVLSYRLLARDPLAVVLGAFDGQLSSPEQAAAFAVEQIDYALENLQIGAAYQWHPFGLQLGDAALRVIQPDFARHPARPGIRWVKPEERGENLPSRDDILVAAAVAGLLGDVNRWRGSSNDLGNIFAPDDPRRALVAARGLDLRRDYFPHGGFVAGARMALPRILMESPSEWLPLLDTLQDDPEILNKVEAATTLLQDHLLATETNGTAAFYLPALIPPGVNIPGVPARQLAANLGAIDSSRLDLSLPSGSGLVATNVGFLRADMTNLTLLGIPVLGTASLRAESRPLAQAGSGPLATLEFKVSRRSWLGRFFGRDLELKADLHGAPPESIPARFGQLLNDLTNRSPAGAVSNLLAGVRENLPRFAITNDFGAIEVSDPGAWIFNQVSQRLGGQQLPPAFRLDAGTAYAFSPYFAPSNSGPGAVTAASRRGGIAVQTGVQILPGTPFASGVDRAELALLPNGAVPRLIGELRGLELPLLPGLSFATESVSFDTAATEFLSVYKTVVDQSLPGGILRLQALPGTNLGVRLSMTSALRKPITLAGIILPVAPKLELAAARLSSTLIEAPDLQIHGPAGPTAPFEISASGILARASLATGGTIRFKSPLDLLPLVGIAGLDGVANAFQFSGDLSGFRMSLDTSALPPLNVELFPGRPWPLGNPAPLQLNPAGLVVTFSSDGEFELSGTLHGSFTWNGHSFGAGSSVRIAERTVTIRSALGQSSATLIARVIDQHLSVNFEGSVILPPICVARGRICLSGPGGGNLELNVAGAGFTASGVELRLRGLAPDGGDQVATLPALDFDANQAFAGLSPAAANAVLGAFVDGLKLGGFPLPEPNGFDLSGDLRTGTLELVCKSRLRTGRLLDIPVRTVLNREGFQVALDSPDRRVVLLGFPFENVTCSASGSWPAGAAPSLALDFEGELAVPNLPWTQRPKLRGRIPELGGFTLQPVDPGIPNLGFPLINPEPILAYQPGGYADAVLADGAAGYWRLEENIPASWALAPASVSVGDSSSQGGAGGFYHPRVPRNFDPFPTPPVSGQPGGLEGEPSRAVLFDGVDDFAEIPVPAGDPARFSPGNDGFTVELWFQRSRSGEVGAGREFLAERDGQWSLFLAPGPRLGFEVPGLKNFQNESPEIRLTSARTFDDTQWHHVVAVYDGAVQYLYVDGQLDSWKITAGQPAPASTPILLAADGTAGNRSAFFSGRLDEVAFYRRALTATEIHEHRLASGRGGLGFTATLGALSQVQGLDGIAVSGFAGSDGSVALALSTGARARLNGLDLPGFSGMLARDRVSTVVAFRASLPPPAPLRGSPLTVVGVLPSDGDFRLAATGDRLSFGDFDLTGMRATASPQASQFQSTLSLPTYLGAGSVPLAGSLVPLSLGSPNATITLPAGPGKLRSEAIVLNADGLQVSGSYLAENSSFAQASLKASPSTGANLTVSADTGWTEARVLLLEPTCVRRLRDLCLEWDLNRLVEKTLPSPKMRFEWALKVDLSPIAFEARASGTFSLAADPARKTDFSVSVQDLSVGANGRVEILKSFEAFRGFFPELW